MRCVRWACLQIYTQIYTEFFFYKSSKMVAFVIVQCAAFIFVATLAYICNYTNKIFIYCFLMDFFLRVHFSVRSICIFAAELL